MASVVFAHFGTSAVGLLLRTQSRPFIRCLARCGRCLRQTCCCRKGSEAVGDFQGGLKWYWFHLSAQVAFAIREFLVISSLHWSWELAFVNSAYWLTLLITIREVWCFSSVRRGSETRKVAVDGLLDMLLLPVNIIFFCALCVRVLVLQPETPLAQMVPVVIEGGDIYEAFALWSVLKLFVQVVEAEMTLEDRGAARSFKAFKAISLQGVKAWVWIQTGAVTLKLILRGIIAVYVPTACYWASKSCKSCEEWYEENVAAALTAVTFLLCSFAIMFVFYFESGYRHQLEKTEPMWKFLGVKGIVSVTYFQWLVISGMASLWHWPQSQVYLLHCLLYASWMPLLALVHTFLAYPFYRFRSNEQAQWLSSWLATLQPRPESPFQVRPADSRADSVASTMCESETESARSRGLLEDRPLRAAASAWTTLLHVLLGLLACAVSLKTLLTLVPPRRIELDEVWRNISCSGEGDVAHFLESKEELHFAVLNDTLRRWSSPGVAGAWLPLCSATALGCAAGHFATQPPQLSCSAQGTYLWQGSCGAISCGAPPKLPHATPRMSDIKRQNWTFGVVIHYDCDKPGYWGSLSARCNVTGSWIVQGACVEVTCGAPPAVPHAEPLWDPTRGNVSTGMLVRYQCSEMYNGTPTASCGDDGMYMTSGRCRRECGAPPHVEHAVPRFNNSEVAEGWFVGMGCPYDCEPGYHGYVTALCGEQGNYTVSGRCVPVLCGTPPRLPEAAARMEDVTRQNFSFGALVHYDCKKPRFVGELLARCLPTSRWDINGSCTEVHCGEPPALPHGVPLSANVTAGVVVRYQCLESYNGTPSAICGYDGRYVTRGGCLRRCGELPRVPHGVPEGLEPPEGWLEGMTVPYACEARFEGHVSASCTPQGNYSVAGGCKMSSSVETRSLRSKLTGVSTALGLENGVLLLGMGLVACYRYRSRPLPTPSGNEMEGMSAPICD